METVEVLVQMSKEDYMFIKTMVENGYETPSSCYYNIASGIVLPTGHERLIAEPTDEEIAKTIGGKNDFAECIREAVKAVFDNAPTVIEADAPKKRKGTPIEENDSGYNCENWIP